MICEPIKVGSVFEEGLSKTGLECSRNFFKT